MSLGRLCNSARLAGSKLFGGKINEPFPGKTDYRYQCRLGCRTFSVSPNFAQTRSAPILGLSRHDKTMPTQTRKRCTCVSGDVVETKNVVRPNLQPKLVSPRHCDLLVTVPRYVRSSVSGLSRCDDFRSSYAKTRNSFVCRLGRRTFSVSPNFAQTRSAPLSGLSWHRFTVPTQPQKWCTSSLSKVR